MGAYFFIKRAIGEGGFPPMIRSVPNSISFSGP
jgi:hypothetical protein